MKKKKIVADGTFNSFQELAIACGFPPVTKRTKNQEKLTSQREKFNKMHMCKACGQPMVYVSGTNVMVCKNPDCKGIKKSTVDDEGNETFRYEVPFHSLYGKDRDVAYAIFD
jgi:ssDNA-binding Zn-finger/Zn-ribbon topoisomerase 1